MSSEELYPGHTNDARRNEIVNRAVNAANQIIIDESDGTVEEAHYLVARVAKGFNDQITGIFEAAMLNADLTVRVDTRIDVSNIHLEE